MAELLGDGTSPAELSGCMSNQANYMIKKCGTWGDICGGDDGSGKEKILLLISRLSNGTRFGLQRGDQMCTC